MNNAIFITGGSGYIGIHLAHRLLRAGLRPIIFDIQPPQALVDNDVVYVRGDVSVLHSLHHSLGKFAPACVVHLAALSGVVTNKIDSTTIERTNIEGTKNVLRAMEATKNHRIIFASSAAVYGENPLPVKEISRPKPKSAYGKSKLEAENQITLLTNKGRMSAMMLRLFNVVGYAAAINPAIRPRTQKALLDTIFDVAQGKQKILRIYGASFPTRDGTAIRDYVHVVDVIEAFYLAIQKLCAGSESQTVNIGTGVGVTNLELIKKAEQAMRCHIPFRFMKPRKNEIITSVSVNRLAKQALGWQPTHSAISNIIVSARKYYGW